MFLRVNSEEIDTHSILSDLQSFSDYALLIVDIIISKEFIQDKYWTIIKNSKEEDSFVNELKNIVGNINTTNIPGRELLERIVQEFALISENLWNKYSKYVRITKHFKTW